MILLEDSRNKVGEHKNIWQYCHRHGIEIVRQKLDVGDYMIGEKVGDTVKPVGNISCDSKMDIMEIAKNICSSDHRRFKAECQRAMDSGIQLIVLIEEPVPYGDIEFWQVPKWRNSSPYHRFGDPMTLVKPKVLKKAMQTMTVKYGVKFRFCTRRQSPQRIIKYLKGEYK